MISVASLNKIPANVLYFLVLNLSFLSFSALGVGNRAVGGAIFLLMLVMLIASAPRHLGRAKASLGGDRLVFALVVWLVLATLVSSFWNLEAILSSRRSLTLFASSLASWSFLGMCFAVFWLRVREEGYFWPLSVCIVIFGMAVWEFFSFETAGVVLDQTLRTGNLSPGKVSSVFPSTTEFGPLAALLAMFFLIQAFYCKIRSAAWVVEVLLAVLASVGVVLSGSRTAMAGFVTGVMTLAAYMPSKRRKTFSVILVCLVLAVHMAAL